MKAYDNKITYQRTRMDEDDDMEIDPAIAEAMGFAGFGAQKKRKFNPDDGFVDPAASNSRKPGKGKGANSTPLGQNNTKSPAHPTPTNMYDPKSRTSGGAATVAQAEFPEGANATSGSTTAASTSGDADGAPNLEALRKGVRNENGDTVIFLPSFLEDPWKGLQPK